MMRIPYFPKNENGFTFLEFIIIILTFSLLGAIAMQRFMSLAEDAEIIHEDKVIGNIRSNITNNFLIRVAKGEIAQYAGNPFENLTNAPGGYNRRRIFPPNGLKIDDGIWLYAPQGATSTNSSGQTIFPPGEIWHQRRDHTTVRWFYNPATGVISEKTIVQKSDLKRLLQARQRLRGEPTEDDIRLGRRRLDFLTQSEDQPRRRRSDE